MLNHSCVCLCWQRTICLWASSSSHSTHCIVGAQIKKKCKVTHKHILPDKWQRQRRCVTRWYSEWGTRSLTLNKTPAIVSSQQTQQSPVSQEEVCRETDCSSRFTLPSVLWNSLFDVLGNFMNFWGSGRFSTFLTQCFRTGSLVLFSFSFLRSSVFIWNDELNTRMDRKWIQGWIVVECRLFICLTLESCIYTIFKNVSYWCIYIINIINTWKQNVCTLFFTYHFQNVSLCGTMHRNLFAEKLLNFDKAMARSIIICWFKQCNATFID